MPLSEKGSKILANMKEQYGAEKGEEVFYASKNKGTISGVDNMPGFPPSSTSSVANAMNKTGTSQTPITDEEGDTDTDDADPGMVLDAGTSEGARKAAQTRKSGGGQAAHNAAATRKTFPNVKHLTPQGHPDWPAHSNALSRALTPPTREELARHARLGGHDAAVKDADATPVRQDEIVGDIPETKAQEPKDKSTIPDVVLPARTMTASLAPVVTAPLSIPVGDQSLSNMNARNRSYWKR